jgi:endonuclease/exonuclease/phosphatase family metal-dependent hydrolase
MGVPVAARPGASLLAALGLAACASAPPAAGPDDVTAANLNLLHGFACDPPVPGTGDQCRLGDRLDLLFQHLVAIGCPDVVTLQENVTKELVQRSATEVVGPLTSTRAEIEARLPAAEAACGFRYQVVFDPPMDPPRADDRIKGDDEEMILSRYPVLGAELRLLHSALFAPPRFEFSSRHALWARIDHPLGPLDVFTSHLASNGDFARNPCHSVLDFGQGFVVEAPCPTECDASQTVRECQARQLALFVEERHDVPGPALVTGDFNTEPGTRAYREFSGRGWIDSHLAAGNPECDPATGAGCTGGRMDDGLAELESRASSQRERIDYTFVVPPAPGSACRLAFDPAGDLDGDGTATRIFSDQPNPFAPACGPAPLPICWPSDHEGTELDLSCAGPSGR